MDTDSHRLDETTYGLVAVKRRWVPEWLFSIFAWPVDLIIHQPFRWIFTRPVGADEIIEN